MKHNKRKSETATVAVLKAKKPDAKIAIAKDAPVSHEKSAMETVQVSSNKRANATNATVTYTLAASCTVRDSIALKADLLKLLSDVRPVIFDVGAVDRIDTAAMQALYAFVRDRKAGGGEISWKGYTEEFSAAARLLGMQAALGIASVTVSSSANAGGAAA